MDSSEEIEVARSLGIGDLTLQPSAVRRGRGGGHRVAGGDGGCNGRRPTLSCATARSTNGRVPVRRIGGSIIGRSAVSGSRRTARSGCRRPRPGWPCMPSDTCRVRGDQRGLRAHIAVVDRAARGDATLTRGFTSDRSRSRTTRSPAGSSSQCCAYSTAARKATGAWR